MILSIAIWMPIVFGIIILGSGSDRNSGFVRVFALIASILSFVITLPLVIDFDVANTGMQFIENVSWVARYDIKYHLGVDGISVWFVVLTSFITVIVVLAAWEVIQ
jgi:NADH-quinone oxidoreductase subunit M